MDTQLLLRHKNLVRSSFQQILPISATFSQLFYERVFELEPQVRQLFKSSIETQGPKLIAMLVIVVKGLDNLNSLIPSLEHLGKAHVDYGVKQEHYALVGKALLWTWKKSWDVSLHLKPEKSGPASIVWWQAYVFGPPIPLIQAAKRPVWLVKRTANETTFMLSKLLDRA